MECTEEFRRQVANTRRAEMSDMQKYAEALTEQAEKAHKEYLEEKALEATGAKKLSNADIASLFGTDEVKKPGPADDTLLKLDNRQHEFFREREMRIERVLKAVGVDRAIPEPNKRLTPIVPRETISDLPDELLDKIDKVTTHVVGPKGEIAAEVDRITKDINDREALQAQERKPKMGGRVCPATQTICEFAMPVATACNVLGKYARCGIEENDIQDIVKWDRCPYENKVFSKLWAAWHGKITEKTTDREAKALLAESVKEMCRECKEKQDFEAIRLDANGKRIRG